eukprot:s418_g5.t1
MTAVNREDWTVVPYVAACPARMWLELGRVRRSSSAAAGTSLSALPFLELWSDHPRGFPVPKGCFFQHSEGEYTIVFHPREGLASNYQPRAQVEIGQTPAGFWEEQPAVRVTCFDDVILRSEFAVEVGLAYLSA